MFQSNPEHAIGHNKLAQMAPTFAERCGFDNPRQHKAHGKRALGITMLSNSSVSEHVKMRSSRHSNLKTHERYQRLTDDNIDKKYEAMNPSLRIKEPSSEGIASPSKTSNLNSPVINNVNSNVNSSFSNKRFRAPTYNPPSQIVININPSQPQEIMMNHQYPNSEQYFPSCVDRVTQQSQLHSSPNQLQSNPVFLKMLAKEVSQQMYKHGQEENSSFVRPSNM